MTILRNGTGKDFVSAITQTPASAFPPLLFTTVPPILFLSTFNPGTFCGPPTTGRAATHNTARRTQVILRVTVRICSPPVGYFPQAHRAREWKLSEHQKNVKPKDLPCRSKMRMSGLCEVEMSG